ncbi:MAG: Sir2 family NAD-dependent protein deacetylase [Deltaproteobacteria bacterium]|nr:Sir2 family NAD-dependent protein deacetylase [Deltaproteobacteria bacterium]
MSSEEKEQQRLREWIEESRDTVIFTGAGISTESGIPDFRSPGGLWAKYQPIEFSEFMASEETRREAWRRKFALDETFFQARPNRGHRAIAKLVNQGRVAVVITQNIDNLHQESGIDEDTIIELHGNGTYARCLSCDKRYELQEIRDSFAIDQKPPYCSECKGIIKTAVISFGQAMPVEAMRRAEEASSGCELFIAVGSSLTVYPAAGFPLLAKRRGARLVIVNRDPTQMDSFADLVIHSEIGPTLGAVAGVG